MRKLYPFLAALLLLPGCAKEEAVVSSLPEVDSSGLVPENVIEAPAGEPTTILAGFDDGDETRSRIERDGDQMAVLWTKGDSFTAVNVNGAGNNYPVFTTQDDGVAFASFTTQGNLTGRSDFHCFYPDKPIISTYNGLRIFGINLPSGQTAVAGGIAEGMNRAYAHSDQLSSDMQESLKFHNLTSMLKFRLSGEVASHITNVRFIAPDDVAGGFIHKYVDGALEQFRGLFFPNDPALSQITLSGSFEAGKDYYIVLWPGTLDGFRMVFMDDEGNYSMRESAKTVTFERSHIKDIGTINLGDAFDVINDGSLEPILYMEATEGTKPVTIAVVPDGFTQGQLEDYEALAKSGLDALFETEPYKTYRNRFNAYILKVPSRESGASVTDGNGGILQRRRSYFGSYWGEDSYGDMRANDNLVFDFVSENCPDILNGTHTIDEVPIILLINDARYGGMCWSYSNGEGYAMVPYAYNGEGMQWSLPGILPTTDDPVSSSNFSQYTRNRTADDLAEVGGSNQGDWRNTLVHEFGGHCFGRLGDEYWSSRNWISGPISNQTWPVPFSLNVASDPTSVLWQELLDRQEDLRASDPHYGRIGIFQGGGTYMFGRWRSEKISCMIDNRFYFSAWQRYLITQRIFTLSGDASSFSFENWLANDVTDDPVRDAVGSGAPGAKREHRTYIPVPPLPPPGLVEL